MQTYEPIFSEYIYKHKITKKNVEGVLKSVGYVNFFNDITIACLGDQSKNISSTNKNSIYSRNNKTISPFIYLPDVVKEKLLSDFKILHLPGLYCGVLTKKDKFNFNYPHYIYFLENLHNQRLKFKKYLMLNNDEDIEVKSYLLKLYINMVYGMIDNTASVVTTNTVNLRAEIVTITHTIILKIISFLINKTIPIYYIDTDELYIPNISEEIVSELKVFFKKSLQEYTNTSMSSVYLEDEKLTGYIIAKKKLFYGVSSSFKSIGFKPIDNKVVLIENKKYFGRNYKDIFPEYAIW